jgi:hypothetical protein
MPGAHLKPHHHDERDTVWLLVGGTAMAVAGALLLVQRGLPPRAAGGLLLLVGAGLAGWGVGRLLGEQPPPPRPTRPAGQAGQAPPGQPGPQLVPPARRERLGRAGWRGRGAQRLWWSGRWDHDLASRVAAAAAGWRGWGRRRRLPVAQRRPPRHARTHSRAGGQ